MLNLLEKLYVKIESGLTIPFHKKHKKRSSKKFLGTPGFKKLNTALNVSDQRKHTAMQIY